MKTITTLGLSTLVLSLTTLAQAQEPSDDQQRPVYTITSTDSFGTVSEEYSPAMYSKIEFIPTNGGNGYQLVGVNGSHGHTEQADKNESNLSIPSWNLFSW